MRGGEVRLVLALSSAGQAEEVKLRQRVIVTTHPARLTSRGISRSLETTVYATFRKATYAYKATERP